MTFCWSRAFVIVVVYLVTQRVDPWLFEAGMFPQVASNGARVWDRVLEGSQWSCITTETASHRTGRLILAAEWAICLTKERFYPEESVWVSW